MELFNNPCLHSIFKISTLRRALEDQLLSRRHQRTIAPIRTTLACDQLARSLACQPRCLMRPTDRELVELSHLRQWWHPLTDCSHGRQCGLDFPHCRQVPAQPWSVIAGKCDFGIGRCQLRTPFPAQAGAAAIAVALAIIAMFVLRSLHPPAVRLHC